MWSKIGLIIDKKIQTDLKNFYPTHYIVQVPLSIYKFILPTSHSSCQNNFTTNLFKGKFYHKTNINTDKMVEHLNSQAHVVPSVFTFQLHIGLEFGQPPSFLLYENP